MENNKLQDFSAFIEELKEKNKIEDVVSGYVRLERKGGKLWGRCPFHNEKTPSFTINEEGQFYHCFGCGAGGDAIKFIQEIETLPFMDAVKFLCEKSGIVVPQSLSGNNLGANQKENRDKLYAVLKEAARYYYRCLNEKGQDVIKYLKGRGISQQYIKIFGIGYCPDSEGLISYLLKQGHNSEDIKAAGIATESDGRLFDPLSGRLIIPIINTLGDVIAFGGRDLKGTSPAKYKNTAETAVFSKSKNLYAINIVKKSKQYKKGIIVVEGYMDAIALHQAGFAYAVASMGTSLTKEQAKLIKRFTDEAVICYDGDSAGQAATIRGLDILKNAGLSVKVISMPEGVDPDEYIKENGKESFENLIKYAPPLADFKISVLEKNYNMQTSDGKRKFASSALKVIAEEDNEIVKEELLKQLRDKTELTYESLKRELEAQGQQISAAAVKTEQPQGYAAMSIKAARFMLYCLLKQKPYANISDIAEEQFTDSEHKKIYRYIKDCYSSKKPVRVSSLFDGDFKQEAASLMEFGENIGKEEEEKYYFDCLRYFKEERHENELKRLTAQFEAEQDIQKRKELVLQIQALAIQQKKKI